MQDPLTKEFQHFPLLKNQPLIVKKREFPAMSPSQDMMKMLNDVLPASDFEDGRLPARSPFQDMLKMSQDAKRYRMKTMTIAKTEAVVFCKP